MACAFASEHAATFAAKVMVDTNKDMVDASKERQGPRRWMTSAL
jgi:hypothetical protein